jgi:hypothetical protein
MSEKILKVLLSDLHTVRVLCKQCRAIVELSLEDLAKKYQSGYCPICKACLVAPSDNTIVDLSNAIRGLQELHQHLNIEFLLPDKT